MVTIPQYSTLVPTDKALAHCSCTSPFLSEGRAERPQSDVILLLGRRLGDEKIVGGSMDGWNADKALGTGKAARPKD
jgi:hypothetical protein